MHVRCCTITTVSKLWALLAVGVVVECALAGILVFVLPINATEAGQRPVAFLGTWVLNAELSDDLRPRPPEISGSDRDRRGRGGGFGAPGGGGFGGRRGDYGETVLVEGRWSLNLHGVEELTTK